MKCSWTAQLTLCKYVFLTDKLPFLQTIDQLINAGHLNQDDDNVVFLMTISLRHPVKRGQLTFP